MRWIKLISLMHHGYQVNRTFTHKPAYLVSIKAVTSKQHLHNSINQRAAAVPLSLECVWVIFGPACSILAIITVSFISPLFAIFNVPTKLSPRSLPETLNKNGMKQRRSLHRTRQRKSIVKVRNGNQVLHR